MRKFMVMVAGIAAVSVFAVQVQAQNIGVVEKQKAKKVQGDLVPALYPTGSTQNSGEDADAGLGAFQAPMSFRSANCTFQLGKAKVQVGKDAKIKLIKVSCGGTLLDGVTLCAHVKSLATIMDREIDKYGNVTTVSCIHPVAGDIAGTGNWVTSAIGQLTCTKGKCQGTLPTAVADPCPDVDKLNEIRRVEVFDGPDEGSYTIFGTTMHACCGSNQTMVGPIYANGVAPCDTSTQAVLAEMGNFTNGVVP